ncbi:MAG TPA: metallophosphoesterase, partial [Pirellulaceae bacterium]|nr:metallophosphoesterase [Pirellulaceae bacterium]
VSDTHYYASKDAPGEIAPSSAEVTGRLIETLNRLPGETIPSAAGGGQVHAPQCVIHGGDVIDSGDKQSGPHPQMQATEWNAFTKEFGLTGQDGKLKYPVYEVHGNHDGPQGVGIAIDGIKQRNKTRPGVKSLSDNGLHYAWDSGPVHFVNLGIVVGKSSDQPRRRRYNPHDSLDFLISDLKQHVGTSGRPVVLTHHIDLARHTIACDASAPFASQEWDPCDVAAYYEAIRGYNVAAIFYGHTHVRKVFTWDGASTKAEKGLSVFNVDNSAHFNSQTQSLFYVEIDDQQLRVREYTTADRWQTGKWSAECWQRKLA